MSDGKRVSGRTTVRFRVAGLRWTGENQAIATVGWEHSAHELVSYPIPVHPTAVRGVCDGLAGLEYIDMELDAVWWEYSGGKRILPRECKIVRAEVVSAAALWKRRRDGEMSAVECRSYCGTSSEQMAFLLGVACNEIIALEAGTNIDAELRAKYEAIVEAKVKWT